VSDRTRDEAGMYHLRRLGFEIRTFECPACDLIQQLVAELIDPMKSLETAGWFRGLHAPT
jgi:hypothetical protein